MEMFIGKIISSIVQIALFALIPFTWWLISARQKQNFLEWIGLKKFEPRKETAVSILLVTLLFLLIGTFTLHMLKDVETATSEFKGLGFRAIPAIIVYAVFNTSFPEEVFFRGFLLKRMSDTWGFGIANTIQSLIFGLIHGFMFIAQTGFIRSFVVIVFTSTIAWFMGYINEKKADGSIIPSWIIHAAANIFSAILSCL